MRSKVATLLPALALLLAAVGALASRASADTVWLEGGQPIRGEIIEETPTKVVVRKPTGSTVSIGRDEIQKIERDKNPQQEFEARLKALTDTSSSSPSGFFELGKWAAGKALRAEAEKAYLRAIGIDPDYQAAREALGHRKYKGKWYDEAGYKRAVENLVEWRGQWVTVDDRDRLEQGLVKNPGGDWVRKEDLERQGMDRKAEEERQRLARLQPKPPPPVEKPPSGDPRGEPKVASGSGAGPRAGKPIELEPEDTAWYDDHATICSWDEATKQPYESQSYMIYTNIKPEYAKRYGRMMDVYAAKYRVVFNADANIHGAVPKGKIYIYPDNAAFQKAEHVGEGVGGFYQPGANRVVCFHGRFGMTGTTRTVLTHEGTHQFEDFVLQSKMMQAPIWIIEGFAVFFESAKWDGKQVQIGFIPHDRLMNLKQGVTSGNYIRLTELIRTEQAAFTGYHYAHAWSLIYYMVYGGKTKKERANNQLIFSNLFFLSKNKGTPVTPEDVEAMWKSVYGKDLASWEETWKQWILDLPYDFDPNKDPSIQQGGGGEKEPPKPVEPTGPGIPLDGGDAPPTTPRDPNGPSMKD